MANSSVIARVILVVGGGAYAMLCIPAIARGGREPFDPGWYAVTYLWIAPVCLSAVFETSSAPGRRLSLLIYALITAYFNSGTIMDMSPRRMNPMVMGLWTAFFFGPFHLVVAFAVEFLLQWILRRRPRRIAPGIDPPPILRSRLLAGLVGCSTVVAAVAFPIVYRLSVLRAHRAHGIAAADADWQSGTAGLHREWDLINLDDVFVTIEVDQETGLPLLHRSMRDIGFADAYDSRIRELIDLHGLPAWNMKADMPDAKSLIALLDDPDFTEVTEFPFYVTPKIVVMRGGTVTFGESTYSAPADCVSVVSERGVEEFLRDGQRNYAKKKGNTIIIRGGNKSLLVLDPHGRKLAFASR